MPVIGILPGGSQVAPPLDVVAARSPPCPVVAGSAWHGSQTPRGSPETAHRVVMLAFIRCLLRTIFLLVLKAAAGGKNRWMVLGPNPLDSALPSESAHWLRSVALLSGSAQWICPVDPLSGSAARHPSADRLGHY